MSKKVKGNKKIISKKLIIILCVLVIVMGAAGVLVWFLVKRKQNKKIQGNQPFSNPTELRLAILDYYKDKNSQDKIVKKYGVIKNWVLSNLTSLELAFAGDNVTDPLDDNSTKKLNNEDLKEWDISSVKNMQMMCYGNKYFNNGTIKYWDVSSVTNMNQCFAETEFYIDISKWDVSNVVDMYAMFQNSNFNIDISNWNVNKVVVWDNAFQNCPLGNPENINLLPPKFR